MSPEVAAAWQTIVARRGRIRIADLAASCGCSHKLLRSRFTAQIGLTPKRAAMLVRFDHAARALRAGHSPSNVALACGYSDQPHLHRDVLALAGCTPGALAGTPRPPADVAGTAASAPVPSPDRTHIPETPQPMRPVAPLPARTGRHQACDSCAHHLHEDEEGTDDEPRCPRNRHGRARSDRPTHLRDHGRADPPCRHPVEGHGTGRRHATPGRRCGR
ncbi:helix-turn-helix transcriptional regulator [Streptomyces sp. NPDC058128]|uniref:helix-turn-helix transcriptional regulator n=1 Tax=Streptomyces sp. NPDC058128 TaxID=3346352 RepID=UPI0036E5D6D1